MAHDPHFQCSETLSRIGKKLRQSYADGPQRDNGRLFDDLLKRLEEAERKQMPDQKEPMDDPETT